MKLWTAITHYEPPGPMYVMAGIKAPSLEQNSKRPSAVTGRKHLKLELKEEYETLMLGLPPKAWRI
eukprot:scaffold86942_cov31-Prasinocladus_malaysianus.AAC.1